MTHPVVEAVARIQRTANAYEIVAEVLRAAREPSDGVGRAIRLPFPEPEQFAVSQQIAGMSWRAGIDALLKEIER